MTNLRLYALLIILVLAKIIVHTQNIVVTERITIENKLSGKIIKRDSVCIPLEQVINAEGMLLFPDTICFHDIKVYVNLPIKNLKTIGYVNGSKTYDILIEDNPHKPVCDTEIKRIPILSFWKFGDLNSNVSFEEEVNIKHSVLNDLFCEVSGEMVIDTKTLHYRKRKYFRNGLTILYVNCPDDKLPLCDFIFDSIRINDMDGN